MFTCTTARNNDSSLSLLRVIMIAHSSVPEVHGPAACDSIQIISDSNYAEETNCRVPVVCMQQEYAFHYLRQWIGMEYTIGINVPSRVITLYCRCFPADPAHVHALLAGPSSFRKALHPSLLCLRPRLADDNSSTGVNPMDE